MSQDALPVNEAEIIDHQTGEIIPYEPPSMIVARPPQIVLEEAQLAAKALAEVIQKKKKPVMFNGEQYLEFEDWQTVGRFYGVSVKVSRTNYAEFGDVKGFEAFAEVIDGNGRVVSSAEAMCLNDEQNWGKKPLFQLRSMAQTRACAKALRNALAWVVVLAGYRATPAEEMSEVRPSAAPAAKPPVRQPERRPAPSTQGDCITENQAKRLFAIRKGSGVTDEQMTDFLLNNYDLQSDRDILKADYDEIVEIVRGGLS